MYGLWGILSARMLEKDRDLYDIFKDWEAEHLNIKFCKHLLGVGKKSTNLAIISELGRYPMFCSILQGILLYWHRLENCSESSLLHSAYTENINLNSNHINCWYKNIQRYREKLGILISNCKSIKLSSFKKQIKNHIRKQFLLYWSKQREECLKSGKLSTYFMYKDKFTMEKYMFIKSPELRRALCRFRISAHDLRIERGRYEYVTNNTGQKIPLERKKRICKLCNFNCIEDEFHFLAECPLYTVERNMFFHDLSKLCKNFISLSNKDKFLWLMINEDKVATTKLCEYLVRTFRKRIDFVKLNCI